MSNRSINIVEAKEQAKLLRAQLSVQGKKVSHSQALELVAHKHGFRDWNSLHAEIGNRTPADLEVGGRVNGLYMSQSFEATIIALKLLRPGWYRIEIDLDEAVDVVTFDSFSNFRKRIRGNIGPSGSTQERTSNGVPHLQLNL